MTFAQLRQLSWEVIPLGKFHLREIRPNTVFPS